jgi:hypothetical protein
MMVGTSGAFATKSLASEKIGLRASVLSAKRSSNDRTVHWARSQGLSRFSNCNFHYLANCGTRTILVSLGNFAGES